jgi:hypothetical protein
MRRECIAGKHSTLGSPGGPKVQKRFDLRETLG